MLNSRLCRSALSIAMMLAGTAAMAAIDQFNLPSTFDPEIDSHSAASFVQQEVRVGIGGVLTRVDLYQSGLLSFQGFRFSINRGFNLQLDADDFSTMVTVDTGQVLTVDLSAAGLAFNAGDYFMIGIQGLGPDLSLGGLMRGGEYAPGRLFIDHAPGVGDMAFTTYMAPVPEPAAATSFLAGLLAVLGLSRLRRERRAG